MREFPGYQAMPEYEMLHEWFTRLMDFVGERENTAQNTAWGMYRVVSGGESFADVELHCGFVHCLLSSSSLGAAYDHFEECAEVFSLNIRWSMFLLEHYPRPVCLFDFFLAFFFFFSSSSPLMLSSV